MQRKRRDEPTAAAKPRWNASQLVAFNRIPVRAIQEMQAFSGGASACSFCRPEKNPQWALRDIAPVILDHFGVGKRGWIR